MLVHHSSQQHQILKAMNEARDQTNILMDAGRVCNLLSHNGFLGYIPHPRPPGHRAWAGAGFPSCSSPSGVVEPRRFSERMFPDVLHLQH